MLVPVIGLAFGVVLALGLSAIYERHVLDYWYVVPASVVIIITLLFLLVLLTFSPCSVVNCQ